MSAPSNINSSTSDDTASQAEHTPIVVKTKEMEKCETAAVSDDINRPKQVPETQAEIVTGATEHVEIEQIVLTGVENEVDFSNKTSSAEEKMEIKNNEKILDNNLSAIDGNEEITKGDSDDSEKYDDSKYDDFLREWFKEQNDGLEIDDCDDNDEAGNIADGGKTDDVADINNSGRATFADDAKDDRIMSPIRLNNSITTATIECDDNLENVSNNNSPLVENIGASFTSYQTKDSHQGELVTAANFLISDNFVDLGRNLVRDEDEQFQNYEENKTECDPKKKKEEQHNHGDDSDEGCGKSESSDAENSSEDDIDAIKRREGE